AHRAGPGCPWRSATSPPPTTLPEDGGCPRAQLYSCGGRSPAECAVDGGNRFVAVACFDLGGCTAWQPACPTGRTHEDLETGQPRTHQDLKPGQPRTHQDLEIGQARTCKKVVISQVRTRKELEICQARPRFTAGREAPGRSGPVPRH